MVEHYFSEKQESDFVRESFIARVHGLEIKVNSGSGIFSMKELDHGSKLLIENAQITKPDAEILDMGCGYGIVGIAMKKKHPGLNVTMIDINERAVKLCKENCRQNDVKASIYKSNMFSNPSLKESMFDVILTNPPFSAGKRVCISFIQEGFKHLNPKGLFQLVAPHNKGGESLKNVMLQVFGNVGELVKKSGYRVYISVKR